MLVFHTPLSVLHDPPHEILSGCVQPYFESPERYRRILAALVHPGSTFEERCLDWTRDDVLTPELDSAVLSVHDGGYLDFLASIYSEWTAEGGSRDAALPETFLRADMLLEPSDGTEVQGSAIARIGRHSFDLSSPVTADTYICALASTRVALTALSALLDPLSTAQGVFALCRPPGHHATPTLCGGYCFVNTAAVAAREAQRVLLGAGARGDGEPKPRIAVLDVDYHHGNGTSQVFYDPTVLYVSLHGSPDYPWYTGAASERGAPGTDAEGANVNEPLPLGTDDEAYVEALEGAFGRVSEWGAEVLVVSLGVDTFVDDPLTDFRLSLAAYPRIGQAIATVGLRTLFVVLEGGYALDSVGACVRGVLEGFERASGGGGGGGAFEGRE
ncbi:hypothetical protein JCM3775_002084 [Rhodotorula graminis]|uniref:Histone deacetylase domain-containing protein n=1 Tax=Rhodotorula graminis (strain WP1) TaxID=578459 RepID=A0A0P9F168_RHOGW|nr:uncharacterized protein RHOBADRAFT_45842 [Rhodotorula graminis WP1]KPV73276.1 hypothetical protein RHOBADRAFT_45842 [Rhodotorula graminis WP1]